MTITFSGTSRYLPQGRQWIFPCLLLPLAMSAGAFTILLLTPKPDSETLSVAAGVAATAEDWEQLLFEGGDEKAGEQLFFDPKGPARCGACHKAYGRGSDQGPNLMMAAKTPRHLLIKNILEKDLIDQKLLICSNDIYKLTQKGRLLGNEVFSRLF